MATRGELEQRVLELLWEAGEPLTVSAVHKRLSQERDLAYTTIMTVLYRLSTKRLAKRSLIGRAWEYEPSLSQEELLAREVTSSFQDCPPAVQDAALEMFVSSLSQRQRDALLAALTKEK